MTQDFANEDTEADYGQAYEGFYSKYYDELEQFAKDFFIENYEDDVTFNAAYNDFAELLRVDFVKDIYYIKNEKLNELRYLFLEKLSRYKKDSVQKVFKNIIKSKFDSIDVTQLPRDYKFIKFIDEVAFIQSKSEISRMLSYNYTYFEMIYELNRFDIFEIRYYDRLAKEGYPHYKELYAERHPKESENLVVAEVEQINPKKLPEKWYALLYWIELSANGQQPPKSREGDFIKRDIEEYREKITGKSGQSFYRSFIEIDLNNALLLKNSFGSDWKNEIINLSNNNPLVIEYIKSKYTL